MVVLVKPSSKVMDGNQNKVEANVLLLGAENVGKSGERKSLSLMCESKKKRHVLLYKVDL